MQSDLNQVSTQRSVKYFWYYECSYSNYIFMLKRCDQWKIVEKFYLLKLSKLRLVSIYLQAFRCFLIAFLGLSLRLAWRKFLWFACGEGFPDDCIGPKLSRNFSSSRAKPRLSVRSPAGPWKQLLSIWNCSVSKLYNSTLRTLKWQVTLKNCDLLWMNPLRFFLCLVFPLLLGGLELRFGLCQLQSHFGKLQGG